uniref:Uncharacterized protein n=1 Tax=Globodera rostochiensis TaxID=31243 RepID=A0A914HNH9_GLORO
MWRIYETTQHGGKCAESFVCAATYLGFSSQFGFILHLAKCLAEEDGHEMHMLIPIREENYKLADKNEEVQLNVRYLMQKRQMPPNASSTKHDKIYLDIANDLELMDELRACWNNGVISIGRLFIGNISFVANSRYNCHSQPSNGAFAPVFTLSFEQNKDGDASCFPTMNFRASGEDRLELLNFKSRKVREEQLKLRSPRPCPIPTPHSAKKFGAFFKNYT